MSKENKLLITFTRFMLEHGIECEEDIYQNDKVDEDSLELIEDLFNTVKLTNYTRQTNADRIRNMSDEELAKWINTKNTCEQCAYEPESLCMKETCVNGILQWLQAEADRR